MQGVLELDINFNNLKLNTTRLRVDYFQLSILVDQRIIVKASVQIFKYILPFQHPNPLSYPTFQFPALNSISIKHVLTTSLAVGTRGSEPILQKPLCFISFAFPFFLVFCCMESKALKRGRLHFISQKNTE